MLITISYLTNQVILLLRQMINTCAYIRRLNILMSFMCVKKKVEIMPKENPERFRYNEKMLFGQKYEEIVAKLLTRKNKFRELFNNLKAHKTSTLKKDSKKQQLFQRAFLLCGRRNRRR